MPGVKVDRLKLLLRHFLVKNPRYGISAEFNLHQRFIAEFFKYQIIIPANRNF